MDSDVARTIVVAITAVGALVWLAALTFQLRASRERQSRANEAAERFAIEGPSSEGAIVGESEVDGQPEALAAKLASLLARDGLGPLGPIKIVACHDCELVFEPASSGSGATAFRRAQIRFLAVSGTRTRVEYVVETSTGRIMLGLGWLFLALGLTALVGGCWLMFTYVVSSPNPNLRVQSIQMVQALHFVWPPFLFAFVSRQSARLIRTRIDALIHNLPYA